MNKPTLITETAKCISAAIEAVLYTLGDSGFTHNGRFYTTTDRSDALSVVQAMKQQGFYELSRDQQFDTISYARLSVSHSGRKCYYAAAKLSKSRDGMYLLKISTGSKIRKTFAPNYSLRDVQARAVSLSNLIIL